MTATPDRVGTVPPGRVPSASRRGRDPATIGERTHELRQLQAIMLVTPGVDLPDLEDLLDRPAWHADALCREYPDVDFFPGRGQNVAAAKAKAVCAQCLVRNECASWALEHDTGSAGGLIGIWGGLSGRDRLRSLRAAS